MLETDVVIIGGGAAGLFCAIEAGKRGRSVVVLEHSDRIGKKIGISGGGRCNFTNLHTAPENFLSDNPHFCKSALARYKPEDFIRLIEKHGIGYHEKKLGQLFCNEGSQRIIEMLLAECSEAGVKIICRSVVDHVGHDQKFQVMTNHGEFAAESLVIATGGLSIPPLGATDFGYQIARQFGLKIRDPWPGLVPFTLSREVQQDLSQLSGISIDALVSCNGRHFRENILVTHRGLSGPAILQISSFWRPGLPVEINLLPDHDALKLLNESRDREITLGNYLARFLPRRFALAWCEMNATSLPLKRYSAKQLAEIARKLNQWSIVPAGTEGYKKAEVTAGGVASSELSSRDMQSKNVPGLYFIGEVVDVTGHLGGYNFQWAWSSGYVAGQSV